MTTNIGALLITPKGENPYIVSVDAGTRKTIIQDIQNGKPVPAEYDFWIQGYGKIHPDTLVIRPGIVEVTQ